MEIKFCSLSSVLCDKVKTFNRPSFVRVRLYICTTKPNINTSKAAHFNHPKNNAVATKLPFNLSSLAKYSNFHKDNKYCTI